MSVNIQNNSVYGFNSPLTPIINPPIIADRAPTSSDLAGIGQEWCDIIAGDVYFLAQVEGSEATWVAASGNGTVLTDLTVNPGPTSITGDFTVSGTNVNLSSTADMNLTATGAGIDLNLASTGGSITLQASENAANAIHIQADGGAAATIFIDNPSGTAADAIKISAPSGGIDVDVDSIDLATVGAFTITAGGDLRLESSANDVIIVGNDTVNITGEGAFANAIALTTSDLTGGIQINSGTTGIDVASTGLIDLDAAASSHFTVTGAGADLLLNSAGGSVTLRGSEAVATAVLIEASDAAGGIDINAGTGGITVDTTAGFSIDGASASNVTVTGAAADLTLSSSGGSVNMLASEAAANAIRIQASNAAGGIDIDAGTGAITIDTTGVLSLDSAAASNLTVTGAFDLTVNSTLGSVIINGGEAVVDAIQLTTAAGGGIDVNAGTAGMTIDSTGLLSIDSAGTTNLTTTGAFDLTVASTAGSVIVNGGEAVVDAIQLTTTNAAGGIDVNAGTGGITVDTTGLLSLDAAGTTNLTTTGAFDLTVNSTLGSVIINGGEAVADAIQLTAGNAAGGVRIASGAAGTGGVTLVGGTTGNIAFTNIQVAAAGGPAATVTVVNNSRVGSCTFSGYTQAAAATLVLTLTNSFISATSPIIAAVQNAGANDAQMQITRIKQGSGTADITITNQGAAALNGDMVLSFIVLA